MRKRVLKHFLPALLIILAALILPAARPARAAETSETLTGTCGEHADWSFQNGILTVSGTGAMTAGQNTSLSPIFKPCGKITEIIVEEGITEIGSFAQLDVEKVMLPQSLVKVHPYAFASCRSLKEIALPDGVTSIGTGCFAGCTGLRSVRMPDTIAKIEASAFINCSSLSGISLGSSLTFLGAEAFAYCKGLTEVTIPSSLQTFGNGPFAFCTGLTRVAYHAANANADAPNGTSSLLRNAGDTNHPVTLTLGDTVQTLPVYFLSDSKYVSDIKGGAGLTGIGHHAFNGCSGLKEITLPDAVTELPANSFSNCASLTNIRLSNKLTSVGADAFFGCVLLESVSLPDTVTQISDRAFYHCYALKSINLPGLLRFVGESAFRNCKALTSVLLPDSVTEVKEYAFSECASLETIRFSKGMASVAPYLCKACPKLSSVTLPDAATEIGRNAFDQCTSLKTLDLPRTLTSIGMYAFRESGLTAAVIPDSVTSLGDCAYFSCAALESITLPAGITVIPYRLCRDCTSLSAVRLPSGATAIKSDAFFGCTALTAIRFPDTLQQIDANAFQNCKSLSDFTLPGALQQIGSNAFQGCSALTALQFPEALIQIGTEAFKNCVSLTELTIPEAIQSLGNYAFSGCDIKTITYRAAACTVGANAFSDCSKETVSAVIADSADTLPDRLFADCRKLVSIEFEGCPSQWGESLFLMCTSLTTVTLPSAMKEIPYGMFNDCQNLSELVFSENLVSVGDYAFSHCKSLQRVSLPKTLLSIGDYAFFQCSALTDAALPDALQSLGEKCFSGTALNTENTGNLISYCGWALGLSGQNETSVHLPEGIRGIASSAFCEQPNLSSAALPDTLRFIGDSAFKNCRSLNTVTGGANLTLVSPSAFDNTPWLKNSDYVIMGGCLIRCNLAEEDITVPNSIKQIAPGAFSSNQAIKRVRLPEGLTELPSRTFWDCKNLTEVLLPSSMQIIGDAAFGGSGIASVVLPQGLTDIDSSAFANCKNLKEITLPAALTTIGSSAFGGSGLTSVTFEGIGELSLVEASLRYGAKAFKGIPSWENTVLSWYSDRHFSLESKDGTSRLSMIARLMARSAMHSGEVNSLKDAYDWLCSHCAYTLDVGYHHSFADGPFFYNVASCQGVALAMRAFLDELGLPNYILFGTVTGAYGRRSHAWNQVYIGGRWYHIDAADTKKGDYSTYMKTDRDLESNYTWDQETASRRQEETERSYIPRQDPVTQPLTFTQREDGTYGVAGCYPYQEGTVTVPSAYRGKPVTAIENEAFLNCRWLENIILPEGITTVGDSAFSGCIALQKLVFPSTLKSLGQNAFKQCILLKEVDLSATSVPAVDTGSFADTASLHVLKLPAEAIVGNLFGTRPIINNLSGSVSLHVYGYTGSSAEEFASGAGYTFTSIGSVKKQTLTGVQETYTLYEGLDKADIQAVSSAGGALTYSSADTTVATVTKNGQIRPVGAGETEITVTAGRIGTYGEASVTAKVIVLARLSQKITGVEDSYSIYEGADGIRLTAASTGGGKITYRSKNASIVRINMDSGVMTPIRAGTAELEIEAAETIQYTKAVKSIRITVLPKIDFKTVPPKITLEPAVLPYTGDICRPALTVSVSGETLLLDRDYTANYPESRMPGQYQVQILGKGIYTGTVTADFEIVKRENAISGLLPSYTGIAGESLRLNPVTAGSCRYLSSNETVAYVPQNSQTLMFQNPGTAEITAITDGTNTDTEARFTFTVTVREKNTGGSGSDGSGGSDSDGSDSGGSDGSDSSGSGSDGSDSGSDGSGSGGSDSSGSGSGGSGPDSSGSGGSGPDGSGGSGSPVTHLAVPALQTPVVCEKGITIKWKPVSGALSYTIYRKSGKKAWAELAFAPGGQNSYTDKTAANGILYSYTVQAVCGAVKSSYSTAGKQFLYLNIPAISKVKNNGAKKVSVTWKKNKKATGYQVQYAPSPAFKGAKTIKFSSSKKSGTLSKLSKNKTYYIRIRAYRKASGKTWYSAYSKAKKVKIKK